MASRLSSEELASNLSPNPNQDTFVGDKGELFADEVRAARANGFPIVMVHENEEAAGGCEFARFFETTPQVTPTPNPTPRPQPQFQPPTRPPGPNPNSSSNPNPTSNPNP